jgi:hypothetical protein
MIGAMFLACDRRELNRETYEYLTLVETYRTERWPHQRIVATLGRWLDWNVVVERRSNGCSGGPLWAEDLSGVRVERVHDFGEVYLALSLRRAFGFGRTSGRMVEPGREAV